MRGWCDPTEHADQIAARDMVLHEHRVDVSQPDALKRCRDDQRAVIDDELTTDDQSTTSFITFDHLLVQGRLAAGGTLSAEVPGGRPPETPFVLDVVGEKGALRLDGGAPRGAQSGRPTLSLNGGLEQVEEGELAAMPDAAANVAGVYANPRDDIANGSFAVPGFDHAVKLTQLIIDLLASSESGLQATALGWPE